MCHTQSESYIKYRYANIFCPTMDKMFIIICRPTSVSIVFPFYATLSVVNSIQLNFCVEVFDLDLFARVAFIQIG
jgi:hypothetical protein